MMNEIISLLLIVIILLGSLFIFIRISVRLRRKGGSLTSVLFGATYEFYNKDKRHAVKEVVELKAEKKKKEQDSDDPSDGGETLKPDDVARKLFGQ